MARKTKLLMKRSLMLIMSLAVALTILPKVGQNVYAAEESKMENGTVDVTVNDAPETTTVVNYGGYSWYVIKDENGSLKLFSKDADFGTSPFRAGQENPGPGYAKNVQPDRGNPDYPGEVWYFAVNPGKSEEDPGWTRANEYEGSTIEQKLSEIQSGTNSTFVSKEQKTASRLGLLTWDEAENITTALKNNRSIDGENFWWVSSPYTGELGDTVSVFGWGECEQGADRIDFEHIVRPTFSLNKSLVLFTSSANGGKESATVGGGLASIRAIAGTNANSPIKFTFKDDDRSDFALKPSKKNGNVLSIRYENAKTGANEFISAIIKDKNGNLKYYGKLAVANASGIAELVLPADFDEANDKLYIFNEQANGGMNSDFASEMREVEIENTSAQSVSASGAAVPQTNVASVKAKAPNTGDNSGLDAWLMIMGLASVSAMGTMIYRRKLQK